MATDLENIQRLLDRSQKVNSNWTQILKIDWQKNLNLFLTNVSLITPKFVTSDQSLIPSSYDKRICRFKSGMLFVGDYRCRPYTMENTCGTVHEP